MWLVEHNRCWTADRLARRSMDHLDCCPLCDQQEEMINHLLFSCVFARQFWDGLLSVVDLQELVLQVEASFEEWWSACGRSRKERVQFPSDFGGLVYLEAKEEVCV
jgi:hypothetical protein